MPAAHLYEVFTSVQGEGLFVGRRQLFVRFALCNLDCPYCDTRYAIERCGDARFENTPFSGIFYTERNPTPPFRLAEYIDLCFRLDPTIHSISLTGGEPLLQDEFVRFFLETYGKNRLYCLETNGSLPDALDGVIDNVGFVSMDMKTQYFTEPAFAAAQERFLAIAARKPCQVKIVVSPDTDREGVLEAVAIVGRIDRNIPLIIQPQTGCPPSPAALAALQKEAASVVADVRIIPQIHPLLGLR